MAMLVEVADMLDRYDSRVLCDLVSDNGVPETTAGLVSNRKMAVAIDTAEGRLLAACRVGKLYTDADIAGLEGVDASLAIDLICAMALVNLMKRRPRPELYQTLNALNQENEAYLAQLRDGQRVFALEKTLEASVPDVRSPTTVDVTNLNLITSRARGYFPDPNKRLPINRLQ